MSGIGFGHERCYEGASNDWITPHYIIDAFGAGYFDLDPCASVVQPWPCARRSYTDSGLERPWFGNIWLNPPYGPHTKAWVRKLIEHGTGVALIFSRTETKLWQDDIFPTADAYLFIKGRVKFYLPTGTKGPEPATAPSCLIAWGKRNAEALYNLQLDGVCLKVE